MTASPRPAAPARLLAVAAALALVLAVLEAPAASSSPARRVSSGISFSAPVVVDPVQAYGEPDIRIAPDGSVYDSGPWGTGSQRSIWNRSVDGGHTFQTLHSPAISSAAQSDSTVPCPPGAPQCPGGGDTELAVDHTGRVYYADLAALVSMKTATWDPSTRSMQTGMVLKGQQNANGYDRQWFGLWDPPNPAAARRATGYQGPLPVNYMIFLEAVLGSDCSGNCEAATYSTDGVNYSDTTTAWDVGLDGNVAVDQLTGTVLEAIGYSSESDVGVAILTRDPAKPTDPSLTHVQKVKIADLPSGMTNRGLFPVIALDRARNAYVTWVTTSSQTESQNPNAWQIWYSWAPAPWTHWSSPIKVSRAPSNQNVMPWITAGTSGRLAIAWYGTADATNNPSTTDVHQPWNLYLAMLTSANSGAPKEQQVQVTRHPMHYGTICLEGTGCITQQGNRNLADFFQVITDPSNGAVVITYDDTSNELIQQGFSPADGTLDHRGAAVVMEIRQNGGTGLFGGTVTGDPTFGTSLTDRTGDAAFDPIYGTTNIPALDLTGATVTTDPTNSANLVFDIGVNSLADSSGPFQATGASALDYVLRWNGPALNDPNTGTKNPIYYVAAEQLPGGQFQYFAGQAQSIDLCSVSACDPHVVDYPAPPNGGTAVTGQVVHRSDGDHLLITVPRSVVGATPASLLESFSAYTFARAASASVPIPNPQAEAGVVPIEVDGACCIDVTAP